MSTTVSQRMLSVHKEHELLLALEKAGLEDNDAQAVIQSKGGELANKLILAIRQRDTFTRPADNARAPVFKHVFGSEYWLDFYSDQGVAFTKAQLREIEKFPFSLQVLEKPDPWETNLTIFETHFAFLGQKINPLRWRELRKGPEHPKMFLDANWYLSEAFAKKDLKPQWYFNRIGIVPGSNGRAYEPDQLMMLSQEYYNPFVAERAQANILFRHINGVYLDEGFWARCQDKDSFGHRVDVGGCSESGLGVDRWNDRALPGVGVAASRKFIDS